MTRRLLMLLWPLLVGLPLPAQQVLYPATLTNAIDTVQEHLVLSSWAGITAPGRNQSAVNNILIDGEMFIAMAIDPPGTNFIKIVRAVRATVRTPHAAGATVWAGPAALFRDTDPTGGCTRSTLPYVPLISIQSRGTFDCVGGRWVRTDTASLSYDGTAIASGASSTVNPPAATFKISGTSAIVAFTVPAGWAPGKCLSIIPTGNFTLTANAGNIAKASTAVTGRVLFVCYGLNKLWYPSY